MAVSVACAGADAVNCTTEPVPTVSSEEEPGNPGMISLLQTMIANSANSMAPAIAMEGVNRKLARNHSNQFPEDWTRTERGALRAITRSWVFMIGVVAVSSATTVVTGFTAKVAATSAKTCFFN